MSSIFFIGECIALFGAHDKYDNRYGFNKVLIILIITIFIIFY